MIYTEAGKYAIRAVIHLAGRLADQVPVPAQEIATVEGISASYLAKVLQNLARAGIVDSVRGKHGGFLFRRSPDEVHLLEIINTVESPTRLAEECVLGLSECNDEVPCSLHDTRQEVCEALMFQLAEMTVADLLTEAERKRRQAHPKK